VTSPLTQLSLQPSPPTPPTVHIIDESPPATRGPSHPFLAAAPSVDKDWMLQEKDRRIAELTRMLQQKQQLVDRLRSQLQDQQTGDVTFMPHLPITVKEEPQDIPMEEVEEMQAEQQQQEQQQEQQQRQKELEKLILQQNQLNLRKQTQHRRKKTHKQQPQPQHNSQQVGQTLCKHLQQLQPQHNSQQVGQTLCRHPQQPQPQHNSQQVGQTLCRHPQLPQPQHNSQQVGQKLCKHPQQPQPNQILHKHPQQPQPQPQHNSQQVGQTVCKHHQQQARHTSQQVSQAFTSHQPGAPSSLPVNGIKSGSSRTLLTDNNGNHFLQKLANHNTDNKANNGPQNNQLLSTPHHPGPSFVYHGHIEFGLGSSIVALGTWQLARPLGQHGTGWTWALAESDGDGPCYVDLIWTSPVSSVFFHGLSGTSSESSV
ncbi:hypothetical protein NFI96_031257, partial [Prochilodus magdalenae]